MKEGVTSEYWKIRIKLLDEFTCLSYIYIFINIYIYLLYTLWIIWTVLPGTCVNTLFALQGNPTPYPPSLAIDRLPSPDPSCIIPTPRKRVNAGAFTASLQRNRDYIGSIVTRYNACVHALVFMAYYKCAEGFPLEYFGNTIRSQTLPSVGVTSVIMSSAEIRRITGI